MKNFSLLVYIIILILCCMSPVKLTDLQEEEQNPSRILKFYSGTSVTCAEECHSRREKFIVGIVRTAITTSLTTTTVTIPSICYQDLNAMACTGKRKKRQRNKILYQKYGEPISDVDVDGSLEVSSVPSAPKVRMKRLLIWSTSTDVVIITATFTDAAAVLSISISCTVAGQALPPMCAR